MVITVDSNKANHEKVKVIQKSSQWKSFQDYIVTALAGNQVLHLSELVFAQTGS